MSYKKDSGIFKTKKGTWGYRFTIIIDGDKVSKRKTTDEHGNLIYTKTDAIKTRRRAIELAFIDKKQVSNIKRKTYSEVYKEFCENGRSDRAYTTKLKQDSLWTNHLASKFGSKYVDEVSVGEINSYLSDLYYKEGYSFKYTESFLKMFYLILGQAYSRNYLSIDVYQKLCVNKDTKIHMPKLKIDDDTDIVTFSRDELKMLDCYFKGTNAETAYLLGRYCGLRINEAFGLKWDNVDLENGVILIDRQMQYQNGLIKLVPVKTRNGKRTVYLNKEMLFHLKKKYHSFNETTSLISDLRIQRSRQIEDVNGQLISSTDLVNCLNDGTIQTVNSFKYPTREIKNRLGINFKFHYLRHTYGTMMADMNTPQHLLCNQMGHGNIHVTQSYYLGISTTGIDQLKRNINKL